MLGAGPAAERPVTRRPADTPGYQLVRRTELHLSVFVRTGDRFGDRPLYREIIDRARAAGLSGATAVRGMTGFGASGKLRWPGVERRGSGPILIEITDDAARVRAFLPILDQLVGSGLVVLKPVSVTRRADAPVASVTSAQ